MFLKILIQKKVKSTCQRTQLQMRRNDDKSGCERCSSCGDKAKAKRILIREMARLPLLPLLLCLSGLGEFICRWIIIGTVTFIIIISQCLFFPTCWSVAGLNVTWRLRRRHVTAWLIQNSVFQCFCSLWLLLMFSSSYVFNPRSQSKYFEEQNTFKILNLNVFNASKH